MYKYILQGAGDINWMALFALLTFFLLFLISFIMVLGKSKAYIKKMEELPLHDSYSPSDEKENSHE